MSIDQLLDDVQEELAALWGSGLSLPGPDRPTALRTLAKRFADAGLAWTAEELGSLATSMETPDQERACYTSMQAIAAWSRTFRVGWALERARARLADGSEGKGAVNRRPSGFTGTVSLLGVEWSGDRLLLHAVDEQRRRVTLWDEVGDVDERDPLGQPLTSKLFQERLTYRDVLAHDVRLDDHPASGGRGPTVFGPAFYTRPSLVTSTGLARERLLGGRITKGGLHRVRLVVRPGGDGWRFEHDGGDVAVSVSDALAFNLSKWQALDAGPLDAVVLGRGDGAAILECLDELGDRCFPAVDPMAIRWSWQRVRDRAAGWQLGQALLGVADPDSAPEPWRTILRWWAGRPLATVEGPTSEHTSGHWSVWTRLVAGDSLPDELLAQYTRTQLPERPSLEEIAARGLCLGGASGRALVEAHGSMLRRGVATSGVVPDAWSLWALADAKARLSGMDPRMAPVASLELKWGPLWQGIVEPLAEWLRGGPADEEVAGALFLVRAAGEAARCWVGGAV